MNKPNIQPERKNLSFLIQGLGQASGDVLVSNICDDTRKLEAGDVFLCLPRVKDVKSLVAQAVAKDVSAILFVGAKPDVVSVPNVVSALLPDMQTAGVMLRRWFETESTAVKCIGITGTDGKTSTAWMMREVLATHLGSAWSVGTLGWKKTDEGAVDLGNTTPSLLTLHQILAQAQQEKVGALVLEVSSHGIAQERVAGIPFAAAVWTTMGQDHLEDHGGYTPYLACKSGFIQRVAEEGGFVIANKAYAEIVAALQGSNGKVFWYDQIIGADLLWAVESQQVVYTSEDEHIMLKNVPAADFHVENLASIVLLMKVMFGVRLQDFVSHYADTVSTPLGRLEPVSNQFGRQVYIDYAHTALGLERCLKSARKLTEKQLLLVFGCGGNRDKGKRPEMGAVAEKYADVCWLTSDNPRDENQADIAADILKGIQNTSAIHVVEDRAIAIEKAVASLLPQDVLVIAGKGHETYMEKAGGRTPWSDKFVAQTALRKVGEKWGVQSCA